MEEITFYGLGNDSSGFKAKAFDIQKNSFLKAPYSYLFTIEEAKKLDAKSFPWPMVVKFGNRDEMFLTSTKVKSFLDFTKMLEDIDDNFIVLISRPPVLSLQNKDVFYYLGSDFLIYQDFTVGKLVILNQDNNDLFQSEGLNKEYVYRLINSESGWLVENIIQATDPRLEQITSCDTYQGLTEPDKLNQFKLGFKIGFDIYDGQFIPSHLNKGYMLDPYIFGYVFAKNIRNKITKMFEQATGKSCYDYFNNKLAFAYLLLTGNNSTTPLFQRLLEINNEVESLTVDNVLGFIENNYLKSEFHPPSLKDSVHASSTLVKYSRNYYDSNLSNYTSDVPWQKYEIPSPDIKIESSNRFDCDKMQVRILNEDTKFIQFRIQINKIAFTHQVTIDGSEPILISSYSKNDLFETDLTIREEDIDIPIVEYANKIKSLPLNGISLAGTAKKYTLLKLMDNNICCEETGFVLFPFQKIKDLISPKSSLDLSHKKYNELNKQDSSKNFPPWNANYFEVFKGVFSDLKKIQNKFNPEDQYDDQYNEDEGEDV
jgi:hypothetical protein